MLPFTPRLRNAIAYAETRQPHEVSCLALLAGVMSLGGGVAVNILKSRAAQNLISASGILLSVLRLDSSGFAE